MIAKKPTVLLAACNTLQTLPTASQSTTSSWQRGTRPPRGAPNRTKGYATIAGDERHSQEQPERQENGHVWPDTPKGRASPTPYQIFDLKQNGAYSKAKYYQLVKLYHPDLNGCAGHGISDKIKMERYRLVVSAHTILSDPAKRSAYDRFGAGWDGRAETGERSSPSGPAGPFTHSYGNPNDPIWNNATWEDWERFYERRDGVHTGKRAPVYMANSYFLALIVALAIMGSSLNVNRAKDAGHYIVEQRDIVHDKAAKELRRVRQEASTLSSRQDKIDFFVRQREATLATSGDFEALREERANRVLADREVCGSEGVSQRNGESVFDFRQLRLLQTNTGGHPSVQTSKTGNTSTRKTHDIDRAELSSLEFPGDARITGVKHLASYSWIDASTPTIAVPGSPPVWSEIKEPRRVPKDSGLVYIDHNAGRHPDHPLEPLFRALEIENPDFDLRAVDIISDPRNFKRLMSFVDPTTATRGPKPWTMHVELAGRTVMFRRVERAATEVIGRNGFRDHGLEYEKAVTKHEIAGSTSHHRIINYRFHDLNLIIRHQADGYVQALNVTMRNGMDGDVQPTTNRGDKTPARQEKWSLSGLLFGTPPWKSIPGSKMKFIRTGEEVPLSSTLEIKTRASHTPIEFEEIALQSWISQTPNLVRAYHKKGKFHVAKVEDVTAGVKKWEEGNQERLKMLAVLMRRIVDVVKVVGKATIKYDGVGETLEICEAERPDFLLEDLYAKWKKDEVDRQGK
ncbi:hypothetical protein PRZ48_011478 [Zasmidium cellare]|uniref:J domain-containing protein n=1 Tax=Zasmidium cellare TaxID=395010 RepID=A0ABR0E6G2_ZASCE|nr:hypothetical protein PRZ48_011478 [Zasmidium cellare]